MQQQDPGSMEKSEEAVQDYDKKKKSNSLHSCNLKQKYLFIYYKKLN